MTIKSTTVESTQEIEVLHAALLRWFEAVPSIVVAFSGGVDSALVMAAAHEVLGPKALACIGVSPSLAQRELEAAMDVARRRGAAVRAVETREHLDPRYVANPANRCYFCKSELYTRLKEVAEAEGFAVIADGNNATDAAAGTEERPGWMAARERGIRSPLAELGITKTQVRALAQHLGLSVWDKPAMPCTASRVPHGTMIVPGLLKQIENAEAELAKLGFREFRVRHHGDIARIEVAADEIARAVELREQIVTAAKAAGYKFVTLDLAGFKSGRLHAATK